MVVENVPPYSKRSKRPSESDSESSGRPRKQERRDGNYANSEETPSQNPTVESMEVSVQISDGTAELDLAENIIEVEVDFNEKKDKANLPKTGIPDVLNAEFALRNTSGGIIKLKMKTSLSSEGRGEKIDDWRKHLNKERNERLLTLGQKELDAEIIDFIPEDLLIFVKKSSIILTEKSNLYVRRGSERSELESYFKIENLFKKNSKPRCCCKDKPPVGSFVQGRQMPSGEGVSVEYKMLTSKNLADKMRKELSEYVAQFANTSGGYVYFGISDDGVIKGQRVNDQERQAIEYKIKCSMESKIWINKFGKKETPELGTHYAVTFFRVDGADDHTFVIQVHICNYAGTVFFKEPVCRVIDGNNQIGTMIFERWLSSFLKSVRATEGNSNYRDRFEQKKCGSFTYFSVKDTVKKIVADLTSGHPGELKWQPSHAVKCIKHPALDIFVNKTEKTFQEESLNSGIAYIERCWEINLGLPSTKPDDVICDVLLCCPQMPLVFVSLTQSDVPDEESHLYNKKVAAKLKTLLIQEADCLEKFYVKPVVISHQNLLQNENLSRIYSENHLYPKTYRMNLEKYYGVLEALVLVLARANVMSSHSFCQNLYNLLTKEQYDILHEDFEDCPKVKITGPPGSGKTMLALERMYRLRGGGCTYDQIYFLCSNKPLKARVESMTMPHDQKPLCIVMTFYEFAPLAASDKNFKRHLGNVKHVLADEVQNFEEEPNESSFDWWYKLLEKWPEGDGEDSSFWVFSNNSQRINNKRSVSLRGFPQKKLKTIIRITGEIHRFISNHKYMFIPPDVRLAHDFEGEGVKVLVPSPNPTVEKEEHLMCILISLLHRLIVTDGYDKNRITVLFNNKDKRDFFQHIFLSKTSSCLTRNGEEVAKEGVVFDTIRRYSGEENDIVIGFCPEFYLSGHQNNNALMVSLCSRAKLRLILILDNMKIASRFKLSDMEVSYDQFDGNVSYDFDL